MQYRNKRNDDGFMIAMAMLSILTLTFIGITAAVTSKSTTKVAGNYSKTIGVFNIAEVGLAKARPIIEASNFNTLLTTYSSDPIVDNTAFNDGYFYVTLTDNDDGDSDLTTDSDGIIVVTSTAVNSVGGTVQIETHLQDNSTPIVFPNDPAVGAGAALACGPDNDIKTQGAGTISRLRLGLPDLYQRLHGWWACSGRRRKYRFYLEWLRWAGKCLYSAF